MEFKITGARRDIGQIEVTYFEDKHAVSTMCLDVPIIDGAYVSGEALDEIILAQAPIWAGERKNAVQMASGFDAIELRVEYMQGASPEELEASIQNQKMLEEMQFNARVSAALVKFGLLDSDPMAIQTSTL